VTTLKLTGYSGKIYTFNVDEIGTELKAVGAVYAVTKRRDNGKHKIIYVGQTENLSERFDDHHKQTCFDNNDATCICTHRDEDEDEDSRRYKEADLVERYDPPCNG